jgi:hypothetical protein
MIRPDRKTPNAHFEAENEIAAMPDRADADMASGRFVTVTDAADSEALHASTMARLRERMSRDTPGH